MAIPDFQLMIHQLFRNDTRSNASTLTISVRNKDDQQIDDTKLPQYQIARAK